MFVSSGAMCYFAVKLFTNKSKQETDDDDSDEARRVEELKKQRAILLKRGESVIGKLLQDQIKPVR